MREDVILRDLLCPCCGGERLSVSAFEGDGGEVRSGAIVCGGCGEWHRIEDGIAELLKPPLRDEARRAAFQGRHRAAFPAVKAGPAAQAAQGADHKLGQKQFYDEDSLPYETSMLRLPFWQAFDRTFRDVVRAGSSGKETVVEVGCGTGRVSLPLRDHFGEILGFDISEAMVRTAVGKRDALAPRPAHLRYFVGDAEQIPIRSRRADVVVFSGILHHVERPERVVSEALRVLKPGGRFFGLENNRSAFRPIFDLLMRAMKLWNEKAHEEHFVMSSREIGDWLAGAGARGTVWTSVFLPPHAFNLFSPDAAERLLRASDRLFGAVPWLRGQGGLVLFSGQKPAG